MAIIIAGLGFVVLGGGCIFFGLLNLVGSNVDFRLSGLLFLTAILLITHGAALLGIDPFGIYACRTCQFGRLGFLESEP